MYVWGFFLNIEGNAGHKIQINHIHFLLNECGVRSDSAAYARDLWRSLQIQFA
jgi:hypothetical protein